MNSKQLCVVLVLLMTACAQKAPRCDASLRPINIPSSAATVQSP